MGKKRSLLEDTIFQTLLSAIAATIARLANLEKAGAYEQAHNEIEARLEELIGLKYNQIRYLDDDFILDLLTVNEFLDLQRLWYLAALIDARGKILSTQGHRKDGIDCRLRALGLYIEVAFATINPINEVDGQIDVILVDLWDILSEEILFSLFDLWERRGAYAKALATLDHLIEITRQNSDLLDERRNYLHRISQKLEGDLLKGDLTLPQVIAELNK